MKKKALMTASVASMIGLFNMENIRILQDLGYEVDVAANFEFGNNASQEWVKEFQQKMEEMGVRMFHVPIPRSIGDFKHILLSYREMKNLCEKGNYKLIHIQTPIGGVITRLAAKNVRKKGRDNCHLCGSWLSFFQGAPKMNWLLFYTVEKFVSRYTDI
ncbi:MAG: glycosyltransferase [Ruminococcus flavefaciens]|nr:glycosyltransferase [Ruminococcus flavefaciens]